MDATGHTSSHFLYSIQSRKCLEMESIHHIPTVRMPINQIHQGEIEQDATHSAFLPEGVTEVKLWQIARFVLVTW